MKLRSVLVAGFILVGTSAYAQVAPEPLVSREVGYFNAGVDPNTGAPIQAPNLYLSSQAVCNLTKVSVTGTVVNPTKIRFDDPADTTRDCEIPTNVSGGHLASIPFGTGYRAAARSRGANTVSVWSAVSNPFDIVRVAPAVPTGVRIVQ